MKKVATLSAIFLPFLLLLNSCGSKKLTQTSAENGIRAAITNHVRNPRSPAEAVFNVQSLIVIHPVNQFSENEASAIAKFKNTEWGPVAFKFVFQRNVDGKWFITRLDPAGPPDGPEYGDEGHLEMIAQRNENLHIEVQ